MTDIILREIHESDQKWMKEFICDRWGSEIVVVHQEVYRPAELPGFAAFAEGECCGLVTYSEKNAACEIVTLDSLEEFQGIGSALLKAAEGIAQAHHCTRIWLVTTNDNLNALRFYQKRGYRITGIHSDAVTEARKLKPHIPTIGEFGIPLRDEIELEKKIG